MSRRLPVYLLLGTSGSMSGEPIVALQTGIQMLVSSLRQDPQALESAYLSVITFDSSARQVVPLTEVGSFPDLKLQTAGTTTAMGEALKLVADCVQREVRKPTAEVKGDWKPLVFLFTDGQPTDDLASGLAAFKQVKWGVVVSCGIAGADENALRQVSENVVMLKDANPGRLEGFFKWVSPSITAASS